MATTGVSSGACAIRTTAAAGTQVCGGACVNTQTNVAHCGQCDRACAQPSLPNSIPACVQGTCGTGCRTGYQMCSSSGAPNVCYATTWGWETGDNMDWSASNETSFTPAMSQHHSGSWSFEGYGSAYPASPAQAYTYFSCDPGATDYATMDLRGKQLSAWVLLNGSFPAGTASCKLFGDQAAQPFPTRIYLASPPTPVSGAWFQITGTFPAQASQIVLVGVECGLPADWHESTKRWYIDDVSIN
jgi:hypothetical protein